MINGQQDPQQADGDAHADYREHGAPTVAPAILQNQRQVFCHRVVLLLKADLPSPHSVVRQCKLEITTRQKSGAMTQKQEARSKKLRLNLPASAASTRFPVTPYFILASKLVSRPSKQPQDKAFAE